LFWAQSLGGTPASVMIHLLSPIVENERLDYVHEVLLGMDGRLAHDQNCAGLHVLDLFLEELEVGSK
jgi:hypothetical protein